MHASMAHVGFDIVAQVSLHCISDCVDVRVPMLLKSWVAKQGEWHVAEVCDLLPSR